MKTRSTFVSNSSSSSFLVVFPKRPESLEELRCMMFPIYMMYLTDDYADQPVQPVLERLWKDIEALPKITAKRIEKEIKFYMNFDYYYQTNQSKDRVCSRGLPKEEEEEIIQSLEKDHDRFQKEQQKELTERFTKLLKDGKFIFIGQYSDNGEGALGTAMEHGEIFRNLEHITISNH